MGREEVAVTVQGCLLGSGWRPNIFPKVRITGLRCLPGTLGVPGAAGGAGPTAWTARAGGRATSSAACTWGAAGRNGLGSGSTMDMVNRGSCDAAGTGGGVRFFGGRGLGSVMRTTSGTEATGSAMDATSVGAGVVANIGAGAGAALTGRTETRGCGWAAMTSDARWRGSTEKAYTATPARTALATRGRM